MLDHSNPYCFLTSFHPEQRELVFVNLPYWRIDPYNLAILPMWIYTFATYSIRSLRGLGSHAWLCLKGTFTRQISTVASVNFLILLEHLISLFAFHVLNFSIASQTSEKGSLKLCTEFSPRRSKRLYKKSLILNIPREDTKISSKSR